jgi:hypothetical protein
MLLFRDFVETKKLSAERRVSVVEARGIPVSVTEQRSLLPAPLLWAILAEPEEKVTIRGYLS